MAKDLNSFAENMRIVVQSQTNCVSLLNSIQNSLITDQDYVNINFTDTSGNAKQYSLPSYQTVLNRLDAMQNSLNSIIEGTGIVSYVDGSYRQVQVTPIAQVPGKITGVENPSTFDIDANWFFESLMFPSATVRIDLTNKVDATSDRCLVKRVILNSNDPSATTLWNNQISTSSLEYLQLISLLSDNNITYSEDEQQVDFPLTIVTGEGSFMVTDVRMIDGQIWYYLDSINYYTVSNDGVSNTANNILEIGDRLSYNGTVLRIEDFNKTENRVRLRPLVGVNNPGINSVLSYYEDPFREKVINLHFGAHEYNIVYIKAVNENFNLLSSSWSSPVMFATDSLVYNNNVQESFASYYLRNISDWGAQWQAEARERRITALEGSTPNPPTLNPSDFRVVQINTQINAALDTDEVKSLISDIETNKSNLNSLKQTIASQKTELQSTTSLTEYNRLQQQIELNTNEYNQLQIQYTTSVQYLQSLIKENSAVNVDPKYRIRGFFAYPELTYLDEERTIPEEIIAFEIAYRYIKEDNTGTDLNTFSYLDPSTGETVTGTFSDWNIVQSLQKEQVMNPSTGAYEWVAENVADGTEVNINQVDIPITKGEKVQIKIRSISEAGYPSNCLKSSWSEAIIISFPSNLSTSNELSEIIQETNEDSITTTIENSLNSAGLIAHIDDSIPNTNSVNGIYFRHKASSIAYEYKNTQQGTIATISLQDIIQRLVEAVGLQL